MIQRHYCYGSDDFNGRYDALSQMDDDGDWVRADDCAKLEARVARLVEALEHIKAWRDENLHDGCECSEAYAKRKLRDPSCEWCNIDTPALDAILGPALDDWRKA